MDQRWMIGAAAALVACVTGGTLAGAVAGRSVEGFYTALPAPRYKAAAVAMPASSPADWDQAPIAAAPAPGWADAAGASKRAFFAPGAEGGVYEADLRLTREERELLGLDAAGNPLPVRVHRPAPAVRHVIPDDLPPDKTAVEVDAPKDPVEPSGPVPDDAARVADVTS